MCIRNGGEYTRQCRREPLLSEDLGGEDTGALLRERDPACLGIAGHLDRIASRMSGANGGGDCDGAHGESGGEGDERALE